MTTSAMYWLTRTDHIRTLLLVIPTAGLLLAALGMLLVFFILGQKYKDPNIVDDQCICACAKWPVLIYLALSIPAIFIRPFVPTQVEMAAIMVVPRIVNSETAKELGEGVAELARQWVEELKPHRSEKPVSLEAR